MAEEYTNIEVYEYDFKNIIDKKCIIFQNIKNNFKLLVKIKIIIT